MSSHRRTAWLAAIALLTSSIAVIPTAAQAAGKPAKRHNHSFSLASPHSSGKVHLASSNLPKFTPSKALAADAPTGSGPTRNGTFLTFQLADYLELKVNVGSGNAMVRTQDLTLPQIDQNLSLGAVYNSLLLSSSRPNGAYGPGWRTREGKDVRLFKNSDDSVTYFAPDGTTGTFQPSGSGYTTPKEFKADLVKTDSGWKLTEHETGRTRYFTSDGDLDRTEDRNGNKTEYAYDPYNDRWTSVTFLPHETWGRQITVAYNDAGLVSELDYGSRKSSYTYDGSGRLSQITEPAGETIGLGYDASGNLTSITSGAGATTRIDYDGGHRATAVTRFVTGSAGDGQVTRLAYTSSTQTLVADPNTDQAKAVADVPHTTYTVDSGSKRVTETTDPEGHKRKRSYTPFYDVATSTNAVGGTTTNSYGANNGESLTTSTAATGASVSFAYANPPTSSNPTANFQPSSGTDAQKNTTSYTYSGAGNLSSSKDATAATAKVDYNDDGTAKSSTDPKNDGNPTTYTYEDHHRLSKITPPSGNGLGARSFTYDWYLRLQTATDGAGRTTTYGYDDDDRVTSVSYSDNTPQVTFTYDGAGNLTQRTDASGTTTWIYDARNMVLKRTATSGGGDLTYGYDAVGNLKSLTDGRGTVTYDYDDRNLLTGMTDAAGDPWSFSYDDDGHRTDTYFNKTSSSTWAMHTQTTYDKSGRVTRVATTRNSDSTLVVSDLSYCYSPHGSDDTCSTSSSNDTGLRQWVNDHVANKVSVYSYDKANRLTKATNAAGHTYDYAYDDDGNRTSAKVDGTQSQSLSFNSANQISNSGESYDGAGNQTATGSNGGWTMTYNAAGQMTSAVNSAKTVPYKYAGPDQVEMVRAGYSTTLVYGLADQNGQPWIQSYQSGTTPTYIERDGQGTPLGFYNGAKDYAYATDGLGSVVAIITPAGLQAAHYDYTPYGEVTPDTGWEAQPNFLRYTGAFTDPNTTLLKLGHRHYNPAQGRFTQQDTITKLADTKNGNKYAYVADNPENYGDPSGLDPIGDYMSYVSSYIEVGATVGGLAGCVIGITLAGAGCIAAGGVGAFIGGGFGLSIGSSVYAITNG
ncbi:RHS repeat-associated core domain-containing protein [Actinoallomurus sp. NPDC052274]|uniref:RHS repeat domain-containing protein n=1 Tax=Actinoallomurus sp. NPDC052274 TaxID=3155420 RepID=UPI00343DC767